MRMRGIVHLDRRRVIRAADELLARRNQRRVRQRLICPFGKLKLRIAVTLRRAMALSPSFPLSLSLSLSLILSFSVPPYLSGVRNR